MTVKPEEVLTCPEPTLPETSPSPGLASCSPGDRQGCASTSPAPQLGLCPQAAVGSGLKTSSGRGLGSGADWGFAVSPGPRLLEVRASRGCLSSYCATRVTLPPSLDLSAVHPVGDGNAAPNTEASLQADCSQRPSWARRPCTCWPCTHSLGTALWRVFQLHTLCPDGGVRMEGPSRQWTRAVTKGLLGMWERAAPSEETSGHRSRTRPPGLGCARVGGRAFGRPGPHLPERGPPAPLYLAREWGSKQLVGPPPHELASTAPLAPWASGPSQTQRVDPPALLQDPPSRGTSLPSSQGAATEGQGEPQLSRPRR